MFERTDYNGTALQMLWNAYYYVLSTRKDAEHDTLSILRLHVNSEFISIQGYAAFKYAAAALRPGSTRFDPLV
jgi:hypothetical protein